jgi:hypothetical protein
MNATEALARSRAQQLFSPPPQKKSTMPPPLPRLRRSSNELLDIENADNGVHAIESDDLEAGLSAPKIQELTPQVQQPIVNKEPSGLSMYKMYLNGEVMSKSTNMSTLSAQLQQLTQEIAERQNMQNEVRSKMINLQGAIAMLHTMTAKMKEFNIDGDNDGEKAQA